MKKCVYAVLASGVIAVALSAPLGAQATFYADPTCADQYGFSIACNIKMQNFGGPTMTNPVSVYNIWYGASDNSTVNTLSGFFGNLTGSAYMNISSLYGTTTTINFSGNTFRTAYLGTSLTNTQLGQIVNDAIADGSVLSSNDAIYNIFTARGIAQTYDNQACAFHSDVSGLKFMWVGSKYFDTGLGCGQGSFDENLTSAASHEMFETLTDPMVAEANTYAPPLGWYDGGPTNQGENGDMCNQASFRTTLGGSQYYVQSIFVNDPTYAAGGFCASGVPLAVVATPEPASLLLLATGFVSLVGVSVRKRKDQSA
jgi:hypothetical protein